MEKTNEVRAKILAKEQSEEAKNKRTDWKKARVQEQEERKLWGHRQTIHRTYDDNENEEDVDGNAEFPKGSTEQHGSKAHISKCGSLNKKHIEVKDIMIQQTLVLQMNILLRKRKQRGYVLVDQAILHTGIYVH